MSNHHIDFKNPTGSAVEYVSEIMDEGIVNPDDGALKDYLRRFREEEDME